MIEIKLEKGKEIALAFSKTANQVVPEMKRMLDDAAWNARSRMMKEAPKHTGRLSVNIEISSPAPNVRSIEPMAKNRSGKGSRYAYYIERGVSGPLATLPNLQSIADDYGLTLFLGDKFNPMVMAIAKTIQERGTPANPFVERTRIWVEDHIKESIYPFWDRLMKPFITIY